jgi:hypothetical protein
MFTHNMFTNDFAVQTEAALQRASLGRKLLQAYAIPMGTIPRLSRERDVKSFVWPGGNRMSDMFSQIEEFIIPTHEIATEFEREIPAGATDWRLQSIFGQIQIDIITNVEEKEGAAVLRTISESVPFDHVISAEILSPESLLQAMAILDDHGFPAANIIVSPRRLEHVVSEMEGFCGTVGGGRMLGADIHASSFVRDDVVFVLAPPENVGVIPIRQSMTIISNSDGSYNYFGGVAYEEIGIAVINDIATAKIVIGEDIVEKEVVKEEILGDFEW